jgi:hypothetical protein
MEAIASAGTMRCNADFLDIFAGKSRDFEILERQVGFRHSSHFGASSRMEVERIRRLTIRGKVTGLQT